jgi:hypothetical protein
VGNQHPAAADRGGHDRVPRRATRAGVSVCGHAVYCERLVHDARELDGQYGVPLSHGRRRRRRRRREWRCGSGRRWRGRGIRRGVLYGDRGIDRHHDYDWPWRHGWHGGWRWRRHRWHQQHWGARECELHRWRGRGREHDSGRRRGGCPWGGWRWLYRGAAHSAYWREWWRWRVCSFVGCFHCWFGRGLAIRHGWPWRAKRCWHGVCRHCSWFRWQRCVFYGLCRRRRRAGPGYY